MIEKLFNRMLNGKLNRGHKSLVNIRGLKREHSRGQPITVPWTIRDVLISTAVVTATMLVTAILLSQNQTDSKPSNSGSITTLIIGLMSLILIIPPWLLGIRKYRATWGTLGFTQPKSRWSMVLPWPILFFSLILNSIYVILVTALGIDTLIPSQIPIELLGEGLYRFANIFIIGIVGPMAEEIFFRGFILAALVRYMGSLKAVTVASAIFAAQHGNLAMMIPVFMSGLLLSWLYLKTRSIWPPFIVHVSQNLIAVSLVL